MSLPWSSVVGVRRGVYVLSRHTIPTRKVGSRMLPIINAARPFEFVSNVRSAGRFRFMVLVPAIISSAASTTTMDCLKSRQAIIRSCHLVMQSWVKGVFFLLPGHSFLKTASRTAWRFGLFFRKKAHTSEMTAISFNIIVDFAESK